ncbi:MAG: hypothetical protein R3Y64_00210 [Peptostreptococcaceae bacterium]
MDELLSIVVSASSTHSAVSNTLTYTVEIKNESSKAIEEVLVKSLLSQELKFVLNSVQIDFSSYENTNIISGVNLGSFSENEVKKLTFDAKVINKITDEMSIEFFVEYKYEEDSVVYNESIKSDEVSVFISNPSLKLEKSANLTDVKLDDIVKYTIVITNDGDLDLDNISLIDNMPKSLELIDGTFSVNSGIINSVELDKGILIGSILTNEKVEVSYNVKVVSGASGGRIVNSSKANYAYTLGSGFKEYKETPVSNAKIRMSISNFKEVSLNEYLYISREKPFIKEINDLVATVKIDKQKLVKTSSGISREGQKSSKYKLIVHGVVNQTVEYVGDNETQSINSLYYETPFSTYIILPDEFVVGTKIEVVGFVEDTYSKKVDEISFFRNIELLIIAKFNIR